VIHSSLIPWLNPQNLIGPGMGIWALVIVCAIVFAETGLLIGFLLPGDTLLFFAGLLTFTGVITIPIWIVVIAVVIAAFLGGEVGYLIGRTIGPRIFERKESGIFSVKNVERTNQFFERFGARAVILARFVPVVRTFAPIAAGVGHMNYRKYTIYNLIGATLWGAGVTLAGFVLAHIPVVKNFAEHYIDLVLIAVVVITLVPTIFHYIQSTVRARRNPPTEASALESEQAAEQVIRDAEARESEAHDRHDRRTKNHPVPSREVKPGDHRIVDTHPDN
jgi:membrane-associated protein